MATEFISNSWLMPENSNQDKLANYSLTFDAASSNYINLYNGTVANLPSQFNIGASDSYSFSFWIKSNVTTSNNFFYTQRGSAPYLRFYTTYVGGDDSYRAYFTVRDDSYVEVSENSDATNIVNRNQWNHIVGVIDRAASKLYVYVNGVVTGTGTSLGSLGAITQITDAAIGGDPYPSGSIRFEFDGEISSSSIFDYALSASQVTQLYGTGSAIGNPMAITNGRKPVAYYPLSNAGFNGEFLASNGAEQDYVFSFDGSNDYITCGNPTELQITGQLTLSLWFKTSTTPAANKYLISKGTGSYTQRNFGIWQSNTNTIRAFINGVGAGVTSPLSYADGNWHHLAVTYTPSTSLILYIDGSAVDTNTSSIPAAINNNTSDFEIGRWVSDYWTGNMNNVSIFNTALPATGTESVESLYNYGTPPNIASYSGLQGWWELDASSTFDGSNWSIPDASSNSNTGTSSGMTAANLVQSDLIINAPFDSFSLELDGSDDFINCGNAFTQTGAFSVSAWIKTSTTSATSVLYKSGVFQFGKDTWYNGGVGGAPNLSLTDSGGITKLFRNGVAPSGATVTVGTVVDLKDGNWHHIAFTYNGTNQGKYYTDGVVSYTYDITDGSWAGTLASNSNDLLIGKTTVANWNGNVSNISIYSSELTSAQVTTLYNNGKPFDLNTFAVTPVSWWRLGSVNSSYNSTTSEWTILDEVGTNNGTGSNLGPAQSALVDGIGATGSGTSSGMSSGTNKTGDAPYSNSNAVSYNMSVTAKSTSVPT